MILALLKEMLEKKIKPDSFTITSAVKGLSKQGNVEEALALLNTVTGGSVHAYGTVLLSCAKTHQWEKAMKILEDLKGSKNVVPDQRCYTYAMLACGSCGKWGASLRIFEEIIGKGWVPSMYSRNAAMEACGEAGKWEIVLEMLDN
mmetsp:Transcript_14882/g.22158  ORF Transcript_14882/g.22158 Transcript_14882/m.22158 type:complete len:146 (+) Transcript_14882:234-671(+)